MFVHLLRFAFKLFCILLIALSIYARSEEIPAEHTDGMKFQEAQSRKKALYDPDAPPPLALKLLPKLSLGAELRLKLAGFDNEDLDSDISDDVIKLVSRAILVALYEAASNIDFFAEVRLNDNRILKDGGNNQSSKTEFQLRRGYIFWRDFLIHDFDAQVGRQRLKDKREWYYDETLDAFRIIYKANPYELQFSVSSNFIDPEDDSERQINYILHAAYHYAKKENLSLYNILRQDRRDGDLNLSFYGVSWRGRPFNHNQRVWLNVAFSDGKKVFTGDKGFGFDLSYTTLLDYFLKPSVTVGFAYGSKNFQQTGLQDNNARYDGTVKFKYYGQVFDPELSNLIIPTVGLGFRPEKESSIQFIYHYFAQVSKTDKLTDTDIDEDPSGDSRDIGHEVDIIVGKIFNDFIITSVKTGVFIPGNAFPNGDPAILGEIELRILLK